MIIRLVPPHILFGTLLCWSITHVNSDDFDVNTVRVGSGQVLSCGLSDDELQSVTQWKFNGKRILYKLNKGSGTKSYLQKVDYVHNSVLTTKNEVYINQASFINDGNYTCISSDGKESTSVLMVYGTPEFTQDKETNSISCSLEQGNVTWNNFTTMEISLKGQTQTDTSSVVYHLNRRYLSSNQSLYALVTIMLAHEIVCTYTLKYNGVTIKVLNTSNTEDLNFFNTSDKQHTEKSLEVQNSLIIILIIVGATFATLGIFTAMFIKHYSVIKTLGSAKNSDKKKPRSDGGKSGKDKRYKSGSSTNVMNYSSNTSQNKYVVNSYTLNETPQNSVKITGRNTEEQLNFNLRGRSISFGRAHVKVVDSIDNMTSQEKLEKLKEKEEENEDTNL